MAGTEIKKLVRSTQVFFPGLVDAKFRAYHWLHSRTRRLFKPEYAGLRAFPWSNKLFLDVGANRGQSIVAFRNAVPDCEIVAFEPNRFLADRLNRLFAGEPRLRIEACALSNAPGELTLYMPVYNGYVFDGLTSVQPDAGDWLNADRLYWFDRRKVSVERTTVPARTLDSFNLAPAFIKLHAQRAEIMILEGAQDTLATHRPVLLCAWTWPEEVEFLARHDYRPHAYRDGRFVAGELGREFTWFLRDEHVKAL